MHSAWKGLKELQLVQCGRLTDASVVPLISKRLHLLETLDLSNSAITGRPF